MLTTSYYWHTLMKDSTKFVRKYGKYQKHSNLHHMSAEIISGQRDFRSFSTSVRKLKFLKVAVDYFMKWIKVEVVSKITTERVWRFNWQQIIWRFVLPRVIILNNYRQFSSSTMVISAITWEYERCSSWSSINRRRLKLSYLTKWYELG